MNEVIKDALIILQFLPDNMELPYLQSFQGVMEYYERIVTDQERITFLEVAKSLFERERDEFRDAGSPIEAECIQSNVDDIQAAIDYLKAPVDGQLSLIEA